MLLRAASKRVNTVTFQLSAHRGRRGVARGRKGELEESYLYEVNHVCVYKGSKECVPAISLERQMQKCFAKKWK